MSYFTVKEKEGKGTKLRVDFTKMIKLGMFFSNLRLWPSDGYNPGPTAAKQQQQQQQRRHICLLHRALPQEKEKFEGAGE